MDQPAQAKCRKLVLDAGPLLSLSPLSGLAETFFTVPQVLAELKDKRAREHFERLGLVSGIKVEIRAPDANSIAHVTQWAKKTGDFSVLSQPDVCVLALTYALDQEAKSEKQQAEAQAIPQTETEKQAPSEGNEIAGKGAQDTNATLEVTSEHPTAEEVRIPSPEHPSQPAEVITQDVTIQDSSENQEELPPPSPEPSDDDEPTQPLYDDPSDEDDGEGEWITPDNAALHKSRALDLLPDAGLDKFRRRKKIDEPIPVGCMTADFAMQNVLLQMGLTLVGVEGKKIEKVKTWVLRCHACFKICKDSGKKFCPSCGNSTLIRASVTVSAPGASPNAPAMQIHLKSNFQYKIRGTKYSIPAPKPGTAKTGSGEGIILREDQLEYMRAKQRSDKKREREEAKLLKGIMDRGAEGNMGAVGSWMDPDWMPEMLTVGSGGKGRSVRNSNMDGDLPKIGYGKRNPNERRRKK